MPLINTLKVDHAGRGQHIPPVRERQAVANGDHHEADAESKEEEEEIDTVSDMRAVEPIGAAHTLARMNSPSRTLRQQSSIRAAGTLQKTVLRINGSVREKKYKAERKEVLGWLTTQLGRPSGNLLVSSHAFEDAVVQQFGSGAFAQRLYESQNPDGAGEVPAERLVDAILALEHASLEEHLRITFELLDVRGDGTVTRENMEDILKVAFVKLKIPVTERQLRRVAEALMRDIHAASKAQPKLAGINAHDTLQREKMARINSGLLIETVRFEDLLKLMQKYIEDVEQQKRDRPQNLVATKAKRLYLDLIGIRHLPFWLLFWIGMAGAFIAGYVRNYENLLAHVSGAAYPLAKAFAQVIQPLAFLLLFAVCRRTITALRDTPLRFVFPFDESISFHRLCGYLVLLCSAGHTICHIGNYVTWASGGSGQRSWTLTFSTTDVPSAASLWGSETSITGYIMWAALLIGYPFAMWLPRKAKLIEKTFLGRFLNNFTYFSVTHIVMWFIFYVALILHPYPGTPSQHKNHHSTTWIYVLLPLVLYVAERVWRLLRNVAFNGELLDVELLPGSGKKPKPSGSVTVLRMHKPRDFSYRPGMYMFINVPSISAMEWHPFTITSAPGDPYVSVHIRDVGDWTGALYEHMSAYAKHIEATLESMPNGTANMAGAIEHRRTSPPFHNSLARSVTLSQASARQQATFAPGAAHGLTPALHRRRTRASLRACNWDPLPNAPLVLLDGPYSAPAMRWEDYEVVVLVGAGIGVTPFASVLADVVNKLESSVCHNCGEAQHSIAAAGVIVQKVYFHCAPLGWGCAFSFVFGGALPRLHFYWVVADSLAPNYFASTLETISSDDQLGLIDPRIHLTAVKPNEKDGPDLHNIFVKLGQEALHRQQGVDVVIGLKSRVITSFGRPDWPKIVSDVADNHPGQTVGVFVCGPPPFCKSINAACQNYNATAATRIKVLEEGGADLEAGQPPRKKTVFNFYEEYF